MLAHGLFPIPIHSVDETKPINKQIQVRIDTRKQ